MLFLGKRVLEEYKSLVVKMNGDLGTIKVTRPTIEFCVMLRLS
jgi:hypothetical protein